VPAACRLARVEHFVERASDAQAIGRQFVHFDVAIVPQQQAIVRPEHAKAVAHIVERRVELLHRRGGIRGWGRRRQACGTGIAIAGIQQGAQGDAKIDAAGLQRGGSLHVAGRYVVEHDDVGGTFGGCRATFPS